MADIEKELDWDQKLRELLGNIPRDKKGKVLLDFYVIYINGFDHLARSKQSNTSTD